MKKAGRTRVHFVLLVMGTVVYLLRYPGVTTRTNVSVEANMADIETLCVNTLFYMAFVVLLFGHALLWRARPADSDSVVEKGPSPSCA